MGPRFRKRGNDGKFVKVSRDEQDFNGAALSEARKPQ